MRIFPPVELIDTTDNPSYWEDDKKGGQYDDTGIIIIYTPAEDWGHLGFWFVITLLHEWLHHLADLIRFPFLHKIIHYPALRRILS